MTLRSSEPGSLECAPAPRRRALGTPVRSVRSGCVPGPRHASPAQSSRRRWGGGAQGPGEPGGCASSLPCTRKGGRAGVSAPGRAEFVKLKEAAAAECGSGHRSRAKRAERARAQRGPSEAGAGEARNVRLAALDAPCPGRGGGAASHQATK